jgi:hypothetical protein
MQPKPRAEPFQLSFPKLRYFTGSPIESSFSSSERLKMYCSEVSLQTTTASANAKRRDAAPFWRLATAAGRLIFFVPSIFFINELSANESHP